MTGNAAYPSGTDLRLLLQNCQCGSDLMLKPEAASPRLREAIREVGFTDLNEAGYAFDGGGYTLAIILAESHLVIHTWPEFENLALVDISVCNYIRDNTERTRRLGEAVRRLFAPKQHLAEESSMIPRLQDKLIEGHGYYMEVDKLIASRRSRFQEMVVAETPVFGRTLAIDGVFQASERDTAFYHEPLVHVPLLTHAEPRRVLICGGGDGVAAREALRHPSVEECAIVDIDPEVVRVSREHLDRLHDGVFDDPRVSVRIEDAREFVRASDDRFDVILIDSTDPSGCSEALFTTEFYADLRRLLAEDGLLSLHVGAPYVIEERSAEAARRVYGVFERADAYLQYVPAYASIMGFMLCQAGSEPLPGPAALQQRMESRGLTDLEILSPETFHAMFAIPPRLRAVFPRAVAQVIA